MASYTGVQVIKSTPDTIDKIYNYKSLKLEERYYPNQFLVFKSDSHSALTRVDKTGLVTNLISEKLKVGKLKPRNKEQLMALDVLLDPMIGVISLTGAAGTGKSLLALATTFELFESNKYQRIILTRPMDAMGQMKDIGAVPGGTDEKFGIYLHNFIDNSNVILNKKNKNHKQNFLDLTEQYHLEFIPMQVMRGASFNNCLVIADEIQTLTPKQLLALGTRMGENSKLILLGDLSQRDSSIKKINTGLYKFVNNEKIKESYLVAHLELIKCERSLVSSLFAEVLNEEE